MKFRAHLIRRSWFVCRFMQENVASNTLAHGCERLNISTSVLNWASTEAVDAKMDVFLPLSIYWEMCHFAPTIQIIFKSSPDKAYYGNQSLGLQKHGCVERFHQVRACKLNAANKKPILWLLSPFFFTTKSGSNCLIHLPAPSRQKTLLDACLDYEINNQYWQYADNPILQSSSQDCALTCNSMETLRFYF